MKVVDKSKSQANSFSMILKVIHYDVTFQYDSNAGWLKVQGILTRLWAVFGYDG